MLSFELDKDLDDANEDHMLGQSMQTIGVIRVFPFKNILEFIEFVWDGKMVNYR